MPPITASDVAAKLRSEYAAAAKDGAKLKRVLFIIDGSEASKRAASIIKRWCRETTTLATIRYGAHTYAQIETALARGVASEQPYDMLAVSCPKTFKALGDFWREGNQKVWRGSVIPRTDTGLGVPTLILDPLLSNQGQPRARVIPHFGWQLRADLGKVYSYNGQYRYRYTICRDMASVQAAKNEAERATIIVGDIETNLNNFITSISFTFVHQLPAGTGLSIGHTYVLDWTTQKRFLDHYLACKYILEKTPGIKCWHNGCFDTFMLARHRIWCHNWMLDTEYMWHSWEAELEKSLAYVASITLPDFRYWKAESHTDMLGYNAKDTINTARVLMHLLQHMPKWAWRTYAQMVPLFVPNVVCNLEGFATDQGRLTRAAKRAETYIQSSRDALGTLLHAPDFNPGSPTQLAHILYRILGPVFGWTKPRTAGGRKREEATGKATTATDRIALRALAVKHPVAARIVAEIETWRHHSKAYSTYFKSHLYGTSKRLYYSLNLDGTKTGRLSCTASALRLVTGRGKDGHIRQADIANYGNQIQNSPPYYKEALCADPDYLMGNADKSKSEAECVALISGDKAFTRAIKDRSLDFYLRLVEWFFGVVTRGDKGHPLRQIAKKVNHASSYCMGWEVFFDSLGIRQVYEFMRLVSYTGVKTPKAFLTYLLEDCFHATFPGIKRWWYATAKALIANDGLLETPDGAIRHFWKRPRHERSVMPDAVAHQPQRLSVVTLNRNMAQVFYEVQIPSQFALRLKGQVHDSLVFQYREEQPELAYKVKEIMERPYPTTLGPLEIPIDLELGTKHWKEPKPKKQEKVA